MTTCQDACVSITAMVEFFNRPVPATTEARAEVQRVKDGMLVEFLATNDRNRTHTRRQINLHLRRTSGLRADQVANNRSYQLADKLGDLAANPYDDADRSVHASLLKRKIELGMIHDLGKHLKVLRRRLSREEALEVLQQFIKQANGGHVFIGGQSLATTVMRGLDSAIKFAADNGISQKIVAEMAPIQRNHCPAVRLIDRQSMSSAA